MCSWTLSIIIAEQWEQELAKEYFTGLEYGTLNLMRLFILTILFTISAFPVFAGQLSSVQLSANLGLIEETHTGDDDSEAFQLNYGAPLNRYLLYTISHYNEAQLERPREGISRHKRDGFTLQLWGALPVTDRFVVRAGVGPYLFFDTQVAEGDVSFKLTQGVVPLYSLAASYDFNLFSVPSFVQFSVNQTGSRDGFGTRSYLLGLGVYFDPPEKETSTIGSSRSGKVTFLGGVTYENGIDPGSGAAFSIEYSQQITRFLSWSAAILRENGPIDDLERTGAVG